MVIPLVVNISVIASTQNLGRKCKINEMNKFVK